MQRRYTDPARLLALATLTCSALAAGACSSGECDICKARRDGRDSAMHAQSDQSWQRSSDSYSTSPSITTSDAPRYAATAAAPGHFNLGSHTRTITTSSPAAQSDFNQGLNWVYSFNHDEAKRCFERCLQADPNCAMAHWGIAYANGPHINNPTMDDARSHAAWNALNRARECAAASSSLTDQERGLINALAARYPDPSTTSPLPSLPPERAPFDRAYASEMQKLHEQYPHDHDIAVLYAESLMDTRPWDLWSTFDQGSEPRPETPLVLAALEDVLDVNPNHPGACHLYIHAVEASPNPERAIPAANRLRNLVPDSGHMVHMPSHIDVRTGRWQLASDSNEAAIESHARYTARAPKPNFYRVYMMHNHHFLAYSCMMEGRSADAVAAAKDAINKLPDDWKKENATLIDGYMPIHIETLMRFGKWDDLLAMQPPPEHFPVTTAFYHFARAVAHAAKGDVDSARTEQSRFKEHVSTIPEGALMAINPAHKVLGIADHVLDAEILYREWKLARRGGEGPSAYTNSTTPSDPDARLDKAIEHLKTAAASEDTLLYMEPPDWIQPVRHTLGAILMDAGRYSEAEQVYRDDLKRWPENGWSLMGLASALKHQDKPEANEVHRRFEKAWARADIKPGSSCMCVTH